MESAAVATAESLEAPGAIWISTKLDFTLVIFTYCSGCRGQPVKNCQQDHDANMLKVSAEQGVTSQYL